MASPPSDLPSELLALAAAATLQRVRWGDRTLDVALARPVRVDHDEILLRLADGGWLVLSHLSSAAAVRAATRRWVRETEDGAILAVVFADADVTETLLEDPPERTGRRLTVALHGPKQTLWSSPWPALVQVLAEAARKRPPPPEGLFDRLRAREGQGWPEQAAPPATPAFERVVFGLAQAHDLVRLVRGEARLVLRGGGHLSVLAATGDPEQDDPALAAALARVAAGLASGDPEPALLVVGGPKDLVDRAAAVLGRAARLGRVCSVAPSGAVHPPDGDLSGLTSLALRWEGDIDLWTCLEDGLARTRGGTFDARVEQVPETRIGLVRGLLDQLPDARLAWLADDSARVDVPGRELQVRFVQGPVERTVMQWRLAALAARWTGHTIDLVLAGGDAGTWETTRRGLPDVPEGHVYQLDREGKVRAKAGLLGAVSRMSRVLRALARRPDSEQRSTLTELRRDVERGAARQFREAVADSEFVRKLGAVTPWATRTILALIAIAWALQLQWGGTGGAGAVRMGALTGEGLWLGEPWRWLSSAFLHGAWWHLILNGLALWVLGRRLEALLGPARLGILFVVSCLGGSLLHEAFSVPGDVAVGASSGILGLLAAQAALVWVRPDLLPGRIRRLLWREAWMNGVIIAGISLLPFVAALGHLGGALAGFALVASGLLTLGVRPAESTDPGPTRAAEPEVLRALSFSVAGLAVAAFITAVTTGRPWILHSSEGKVADTEVGEGRLSLPLPRSAGAPAVIDPSDTDDGEALWVTAGDPLRDGLRVEVRAFPLDGDEADLDDVLALYGDGSAWTRVQAGKGIAAQAPMLWANGQRMVEHRWMMVRDGVVVDLRSTALPDTASSRLHGTWLRLPAGVEADREAWGDATGRADVLALQAARRGEDLPDLPEDQASLARLLRGISSFVQGDLPSATDHWAQAFDTDQDVERALRLAGALDEPVALALLDATLEHADPGQLPRVQLERAAHLEAARRYRDALEALEAAGDPEGLGLFRAQLQWHAGDVDEAAATAEAWWVDLEPPLERPLNAALLAGGLVNAGALANRGWARFLMGDTLACQMDSRAALEADGELTIAAYNLALCTLVAEGPEAAEPLYREAHGLARGLRDDRAMGGARRDLTTLADRGQAGAARMLETFDGGRRPRDAAP